MHKRSVMLDVIPAADSACVCEEEKVEEHTNRRAERLQSAVRVFRIDI